MIFQSITVVGIRFFTKARPFWHSICDCPYPCSAARQNQLKPAGVQARRNQLCKDPPHWRKSFQDAWNGSTPKGERVASHDPPLALSQATGPGREIARRIVATNRPVDQILNNQGRGGCLGSVLWPVFFICLEHSILCRSTTTGHGGEHVRADFLTVARFPVRACR